MKAVPGLRLALLAGLVGAQAAAAAPASPASPPARVASLNLTADEVLVEILPPERLVAVTSFADERGTSNVVGRVPSSVVRFPKADLERLVALHPDLVIVSEYTDPDFLHLVERSGLRYHRMEGLHSLDGYRQAILDLGTAVGARGRAEALVARYDQVLAELARRLRGVAKPRVMYWASGMTAGGDTAIGALIESAGAVNVGREAGVTGIGPIGAERAFVADPDVVLLGEWPGVREGLEQHPLLSQLRAVRERRIVQMPTELLVTLSQHAAAASWYLAWALHPDRVSGPRP
ncbi:MAG: ABC transporter substrate-binding protein [Acidobacteria bacterium]|nr:MAG: ABC transporter substrate-binding protein [Acidobacteriota bacterium]